MLSLAIAAVVLPVGQASLEERGISGAADSGIVSPDDRSSRIVPGTGFAPASALPDDRVTRFSPGVGETTVVTPPDDRANRFSPVGEGGPTVRPAEIGDGFHWNDAWLGALAGFGAALLLAIALAATLRTRQGRVAHP